MKETQEKMNRKIMAKKLAVTFMHVMLFCSVIVCNVCAGDFQGMDGFARSMGTEIMWGGIVVVAVIVVNMLAQRNIVQGIIIGIVGVAICVLIGHPDSLMSIGQWLTEKATGMTIQ